MDDRFRTWPRLGTGEIDPEVLAAPGGPLAGLLADLGVDCATAPGAPGDGWRVLSDRRGVTVVGAPTRSDGSAWRVGAVSAADTDGRRRWTLHDEEMTVRPSRAELGRGLRLRWPDAVRNAPDLDLLAIDVVNTGEDTWALNDDSAFVAIGALRPVTDEDAPDVPFAYGDFRGGRPAVPLLPGEYARLPVAMSPATSDGERPGPHHVVALLPELGLTVDVPLEVTLTAEQVARRRPAGRRQTDDAELRLRLAEAVAMLGARQSLHQVVDAVLASPSDDVAIARISAVTDCDPELARRLYGTPLRHFRSQAELAENVAARQRDVEQAEGRSAT